MPAKSKVRNPACVQTWDTSPEILLTQAGRIGADVEKTDLVFHKMDCEVHI